MFGLFLALSNLIYSVVCSFVYLRNLVVDLFHGTRTDEAQKTLEESLTNEEMGFAFEMRQSKRNGTIGRNTLSRRSVAGSVGVLGGGTLGSHSTAGPTVVGKPPPRPTPASVAYNSDDESARGYDENPDDSSLTEKPSEISSTDSQVRNLNCFPVSSGFFRNLPDFSGIFRNLPDFSGIFRIFPESSGFFWNLPDFPESSGFFRNLPDQVDHVQLHGTCIHRS